MIADLPRTGSEEGKVTPQTVFFRGERVPFAPAEPLGFWSWLSVPEAEAPPLPSAMMTLSMALDWLNWRKAQVQEAERTIREFANRVPIYAHQFRLLMEWRRGLQRRRRYLRLAELLVKFVVSGQRPLDAPISAD